MTVLYKERLGSVYEVIKNLVTGYFELYKNGVFEDTSDDIVVITHRFNTI